MKLQILRTLNALMAMVFVGIIMGAFFEEFTKRELPCPLCYLERLGMVTVAIGALMNLRFGIKTSHYALSLLGAIFGGGVALRQICFHICPGFPRFGYPVFGLNLYTWAFLSFATATFAITLLLLFHKKEDEKRIPLNWFDTMAFVLVYILVISNIFAIVHQCGITICPDPSFPQT